jgi:hypothetical protein
LLVGSKAVRDLVLVVIRVYGAPPYLVTGPFAGLLIVPERRRWSIVSELPKDQIHVPDDEKVQSGKQDRL